jgi:hypothetical protein
VLKFRIALMNIPRRVFAIWLGGAQMSDNRKRAFDTLPNVGVPVEFVTDAELERWVVPGQPLHAAWEYLSPVHRSDYLRTYLMHHHGGGYTDVKLTLASWSPVFDEVDERKLLGAGCREPNVHGVATLGVDFSRRGRYRSARSKKFWYALWLRLNYRKLIGNTAYIFSSQSPFTTEWFTELERRLDALLPSLQLHPARHVRDRAGLLVDGVPSQYPVPWTYLLGDIFHPLSYRYRHKLSRNLPPPSFHDYA